MHTGIAAAVEEAESVQPLPPEVVPVEGESEGDPHVVVVVGEDLVG